MHSIRSIGENWFSLSHEVSIANSFFVRDGTLCPLLLSAGIFAWKTQRL